MDSSKTDPRSNAANPDRSAGVPPAVAGASRPRAPLLATLTATFFGAGRLKPGPGTWGSLATVILWALASLRIPVADRVWATIIAAAAVTLIGIPAATLVARSSGLKDPQFVVIDEVAGQLVTLIAVPLGWQTFLAGLILFRVRSPRAPAKAISSGLARDRAGKKLRCPFSRSTPTMS